MEIKLNKEQAMVREFHQQMGLTCNDYPNAFPIVSKNLRYDLIREELEELKVAMGRHMLIEIADAIGDLLYVVYGTAVTYGIDMEEIFAEIHRSNMTKVGGSKRADGKLLKPDTYDPPKIAPILNEQIEEMVVEMFDIKERWGGDENM
jgi:predicted HAD superfamily Cof-like phosphohydrolase